MAVPSEPRYQLAGVDARERGFSRPVQIREQPEGLCALLQYESTRACSAPAATADEALLRLVADLHAQGYRQLKTQLTFRDGEYLGSRELWVEYPDPVEAPAEIGLWAWLLRRLQAWSGGPSHPSSAS
ncbi:MAG: hypothetical protein U0172_03970 [Nitrospiraceae bacterium]